MGIGEIEKRVGEVQSSSWEWLQMATSVAPTIPQGLDSWRASDAYGDRAAFNNNKEGPQLPPVKLPTQALL